MPQGPRGEAWGGGIPIPTGEVSGEGMCPLPRKLFVFVVEDAIF